MPHTLEATVDISAAPERVWAVVSDLTRMPEFSPNTVRMFALGSPRAGTWTININRHGRIYYPSTSRIVRFEPNRAFAFRMNENSTVWSFTLEPQETGTRLIERRDIPNGVSKPIRLAINAFLGGEQQFEQNLTRGMDETLDKIRRAVESSN